MRAVVAAGALLAVLAVALYVSMSGDPPPPVVDEKPEAREEAPPERVESAPAAREPSAPKRSQKITPVARNTPSAPVVEEGFPAAGSGEILPRQPGEDPDPFADALREQLLVTESAVLDCLQPAKEAGLALDGIAAYGFTLTRKDGKVVVDGTSLEYGGFPKEVNDCVRETMVHAQLTLEALPPNAERITAYRKITVADGELKHNLLTQYEVSAPR